MLRFTLTALPSPRPRGWLLLRTVAPRIPWLQDGSYITFFMLGASECWRDTDKQSIFPFSWSTHLGRVLDSNKWRREYKINIKTWRCECTSLSLWLWGAELTSGFHSRGAWLWEDEYFPWDVLKSSLLKVIRKNYSKIFRPISWQKIKLQPVSE